MWDAFIEVIRAVIFAGAHAFGGSIGASIALVTFVLRLALIPLSLRLARRARENAERLAGLNPQLERLQKRYAKDPRRLAVETLALHRKHGVRMFDPLMWVSGAVQLPLFGGLYAAVRAGLGAGKRFLWIADLGRPDGWIALGAAALVGASILAAPVGSAPGGAMGGATAIRVSAMLAIVSTLVFMINAPAATVVSVAAGAVSGVLQGWVGRRSLHAQGR